jgi:hypothetical protein
MFVKYCVLILIGIILFLLFNNKNIEGFFSEYINPVRNINSTETSKYPTRENLDVCDCNHEPEHRQDICKNRCYYLDLNKYLQDNPVYYGEDDFLNYYEHLLSKELKPGDNQCFKESIRNGLSAQDIERINDNADDTTLRTRAPACDVSNIESNERDMALESKIININFNNQILRTILTDGDNNYYNNKAIDSYSCKLVGNTLDYFNKIDNNYYTQAENIQSEEIRNISNWTAKNYQKKKEICSKYFGCDYAEKIKSEEIEFIPNPDTSGVGYAIPSITADEYCFNMDDDGEKGEKKLENWYRCTLGNHDKYVTRSGRTDRLNVLYSRDIYRDICILSSESAQSRISFIFQSLSEYMVIPKDVDFLKNLFNIKISLSNPLPTDFFQFTDNPEGMPTTTSLSIDNGANDKSTLIEQIKQFNIQEYIDMGYLTTDYRDDTSYSRKLKTHMDYINDIFDEGDSTNIRAEYQTMIEVNFDDIASQLISKCSDYRAIFKTLIESDQLNTQDINTLFENLIYTNELREHDSNECSAFGYSETNETNYMIIANANVGAIKMAINTILSKICELFTAYASLDQSESATDTDMTQYIITFMSQVVSDLLKTNIIPYTMLRIFNPILSINIGELFTYDKFKLALISTMGSFIGFWSTYMSISDVDFTSFTDGSIIGSPAVLSPLVSIMFFCLSVKEVLDNIRANPITTLTSTTILPATIVSSNLGNLGDMYSITNTYYTRDIIVYAGLYQIAINSLNISKNREDAMNMSMRVLTSTQVYYRKMLFNDDGTIMHNDIDNEDNIIELKRLVKQVFSNTYINITALRNIRTEPTTPGLTQGQRQTSPGVIPFGEQISDYIRDFCIRLLNQYPSYLMTLLESGAGADGGQNIEYNQYSSYTAIRKLIKSNWLYNRDWVIGIPDEYKNLFTGGDDYKDILRCILKSHTLDIRLGNIYRPIIKLSPIYQKIIFDEIGNRYDTHGPRWNTKINPGTLGFDRRLQLPLNYMDHPSMVACFGSKYISEFIDYMSTSPNPDDLPDNPDMPRQWDNWFFYFTEEYLQECHGDDLTCGDRNPTSYAQAFEMAGFLADTTRYSLEDGGNTFVLSNLGAALTSVFGMRGDIFGEEGMVQDASQYRTIITNFLVSGSPWGMDMIVNAGDIYTPLGPNEVKLPSLLASYFNMRGSEIRYENMFNALVDTSSELIGDIQEFNENWNKIFQLSKIIENNYKKPWSMNNGKYTYKDLFPETPPLEMPIVPMNN